MIGDRPELAGEIPGAWPGDLPADLLPDGAADPDRAWRWRDLEDGGEDFTGLDPDDGPIDTDETYAGWKRLFPGPVPLLPSVEAQERLVREG